MFRQAPRDKQLTVAAAVVFLLSVGMVATFRSDELIPLFVLVLSANAFLFLYVRD